MKMKLKERRKRRRKKSMTAWIIKSNLKTKRSEKIDWSFFLTQSFSLFREIRKKRIADRKLEEKKKAEMEEQEAEKIRWVNSIFSRCWSFLLPIVSWDLGQGFAKNEKKGFAKRGI
jgi:hypothetical protein